MTARRIGPASTVRQHARRPHGGVRRGGPLGIEHFVPHRVATLANLLALDASRRYARRFGLAIREWRVLAVLGEGRPLSATEVSRRTAIDKGRASRAVASLTRRGLIERAPDAFDARRTMLRLSQKGRATYRRIAPLARAREGTLLAPLAPAERRALERLLAKLLSQAETMLAGLGDVEELDEDD
jgi:DNA-binding MarR family transcriptional regulator